MGNNKLIERDGVMVEMYKNGSTMQEIADKFGMRKQNVSLRLKAFGLTWRDGGAHLRSVKRKLKIVATCIILVIFFGCATPFVSSGDAEAKSPNTSGIASKFTLRTLAVNNLKACESSLVLYRNIPYCLYDNRFSGSLWSSKIDIGTWELIDQTKLHDSDMRFSYVYHDDKSGKYSAIVTRNNDLYIGYGSTPYDEYKNFTPLLYHNPDPRSYRYQQWNAAASGDYLAVECADECEGQENVRIALYKSDGITYNESGIGDIVGGGNPWMLYLSGRGLLMVYGAVHGDNGAYWRVRAAVLPDGNNEWIIASMSKFDISESGVHICDPHLLQLANGQMVLTVSYNQKSIAMYSTQSRYTFEEMFDVIAVE
jgi:hypothetical protein